MKKDRGILLFLAYGGMGFVWLYAWANFLMASILHRPFPLPEAIGTYLLGAALTLAVRGAGFRVISVVGLQVLGLVLAASRIIYAIQYQAYPYLGKVWLIEFFGGTRDALEWLTLVIILIFALLFWLGGVGLARRSLDYLTICSRFDLGVAALFCLLMVKLLLFVKGGIEVEDPASELLLFPFFIFSLLAIGLARSRGSAQREFLAGYKGIGVLASFTMGVLAFGAGLVLLFMPYLIAVAEAGYEVMRSAAGPLSPILVRVLRFLFFRARMRQEAASSSSGGSEAEFVPSGESSWWSELVGRIVEWGFLGLGVVLLLILCTLGAWYLLRWLFSRTSKQERESIHWRLLAVWAQRLWASVANGLTRMAQCLKGYRSPVQMYRGLLRWGRRSGLPRLLSETPSEYGSRLGKGFPLLSGEIGGIVSAFNLAVYGEAVPDSEQMHAAGLSWKRIRSPRYWPSRLKSWFLRPSS